MDKNTIVIMHDGKNLVPAVEKALAQGPWRLNAIGFKRPEWQQEAASADCAILVLDTDESLPGNKAVKRIKAVDENIPVVVVSKSKDLEDAVATMQAGAYDYLSFPIDAEKLRHSILNAIRMFSLTKRIFLLESQIGWRASFDNIIGHSALMQDIFNMITMVAKSNATVLITGDSGTGKELVAHSVHRHSARSKGPFIDINCGAIPHELLENELFGHERGAYTGADKRYIGSCERADGGTLFLDEISEMDPLLQVKLLRFLQERSFMRVGGNDPLKVDVRIICATNRDIIKEVSEGRFREDLYYRLNVVPIHLPSLRERREDIPLLAKHFLEKYTTKNEKIFLDFAPQAIEALIGYDWPGNVRELENIIERAVVLHNDTRVKAQHFPPYILQSTARTGMSSLSDVSLAPLDSQKILPLELVEKYAIEAAIKKCMGNVGEAARKLKIGQATLYRKIKQYGLR